MMAPPAGDNERYNKRKRKRLHRFALQVAQERTGRACGECTACCTVMGVAEVPTPFYTPCPHLHGAGCAIYVKRPGTCRDFYCEWLVGRFDAADRPDRLGLLFVPTRVRTETGAAQMLLVAYEVWPGAADTDQARALLGSLGGDAGLIRYGDLDTCEHLGTGRRIVPDIAPSMRPH
jgi:hypothetical protein